MKIQKQFYACAVMVLVIFFSAYQTGYAQSGSITFDEDKWRSLTGIELYHGGPSNTLSDPEMGVDFVIAYGGMKITNVFGMGRMLYLSPYINTTSTTDDLGRVLIRFSNLKEMVKLDVSHDYTEVHSPAYMTVKFYRSHDPSNPLHTVDVPWNGGACTEVEYTNNSIGIQMVIVDTKYAENNVDNLEFTEMGAGPTNLSLTVVSSSQIDLEWQDNSDNEAGFKIERKIGAGGSWSQIGTVSANTEEYGNGGLSANTTYTYRVRAYGTGWDSPYSNEASATTMGTYQSGTFDFNDDTIQDWTLFPPHTGGIGGYYYYYNNNSQMVEAHGGEPGEIHLDHNGKYNYPNVYDESQAPLGSLYIFTWCGTFTYTLPAGTPTNGVFWFATDSPDLTANANWQSITGFKAALYHYESSGSANGPLQIQLLLHVRKPDNSEVYLYSDWRNLIKNQWQEFTFVPSNLPDTYVILNARIAFLGQHQDIPISSQILIDDVAPLLDGVVPPSAPTNLAATAISSSQIALSWKDNTNNEDGFKVERRTGAGGSWSQIQTVTANTTSYTNDGLAPSTTYVYRVRAYNSSGNSGYSNESSATTLNTNVPASPSNLQAFLIGTQVHVTWEDNSDDETGFVLESKKYPATLFATWQVEDTLGADVKSYQMAKPANNTTLLLRMFAFNENGNSGYSNVDTLRILLSLSYLTVVSPNGGEVWEPGDTQQITWNKSTYSPPSQVNIWLSLDQGSNWISPPVASNVANTGSFTWTIPDTTSTRCILKIEDASDGFPYDLSNSPFALARSASPILSVTPDTLDFGTLYDELGFKITNTGSGTLTWNVAESPDVPWIASITPSSGTDEDSVFVTVDRMQLDGDSGTGTLSITSDGGDCTVTLLITRTGASLPGHWEFVSNTGNNATIILPTAANPNIEGTPLASGLYIGAFTPAGLCCGWSQWREANLSITVWGDNSQTPAVDGFQGGELIGYRVYREDGQKEWTQVDVEYSTGTGNYSADAFQVLGQFDVTDMTVMELHFEQGWNLFSVNVEPVCTDMDSVMGPVKDKLKIMKNDNGKTYITEYGINDIGQFDYKEGYQAYFTEAVSLEVQGQSVDPATQIFLSAGWSMISYLPWIPMDVAAALTSIAGDLVIAKNKAGQVYIPEFNINNIGEMEPGQGYQVYLKNAGTLKYPSGMPKILAADRCALKATEHFQFTANTGENAVVVVTTSSSPQYSDGSPLKTGDEIGVFTTAGLCCGAVVWDSTNKAISVWGDNVMTDSLDGFLHGDTLRFRVWDKAADAEYEAHVSFQEGHSSVYTVNGLSVLNALVADLVTDVEEASDVPGDLILYQNYPNPFNPNTMIAYDLPEEGRVALKVYNMLGEEIRTLVDENQTAGHHTAVWNGRDDNGQPVSSGIYIYRLEADRKIQSRRTLFVK